MKLVDTNVLIYAMDIDSPHHKTAFEWIEETLSDGPGMALAWLAVVGFVRLTTRKGILRQPLSVNQSLAAIDDWLNHPRTQLLQPGERHGDLFARLLMGSGTAGNLTNDAHLAALAIEHNAQFATFDCDFKRFSGLKLQLLS
ncbi:MAG: hypothetical protein JWP47_2004 [Polaromonas sp.]|jgi:toxin-antitoxin system PIN domain toxin|nr:hypothetical protein [Polaromonas sp.]